MKVQLRRYMIAKIVYPKLELDWDVHKYEILNIFSLCFLIEQNGLHYMDQSINKNKNSYILIYIPNIYKM